MNSTLASFPFFGNTYTINEIAERPGKAIAIDIDNRTVTIQQESSSEDRKLAYMYFTFKLIQSKRINCDQFTQTMFDLKCKDSEASRCLGFDLVSGGAMS